MTKHVPGPTMDFARSERAHVAGAILAGGLSLRMGEPKAGILVPDGRAMIECVADALRPISPRLIIVGRCPGYDLRRMPEARLIEDAEPALGPLNGLETLLASQLATQYLVVACDQPLLHCDLLARLFDAPPALAVCLRTQHGEDLMPFPGLYASTLLPAIRQYIQAGQRGFCNFLRLHGFSTALVSDDSARLVRSFNTPQDLRAMPLRDLSTTD